MLKVSSNEQCLMDFKKHLETSISRGAIRKSELKHLLLKIKSAEDQDDPKTRQRKHRPAKGGAPALRVDVSKLNNYPILTQ